MAKNGNGDDKKTETNLTTNNQQLASTIIKAGNEKTLKQNYPSFNIPVAESTGTENRWDNLKYDQFHRYPDYKEKVKTEETKLDDLVKSFGTFMNLGDIQKRMEQNKKIGEVKKEGYVTKSPLNKE